MQSNNKNKFNYILHASTRETLQTQELGIKNSKIHCVKSVPIWSYFGPYFPVFRLNKKRYEVSLSIQFECGKIQTRTTPNMDTFYAVIVAESSKHQLTIMKKQTHSYFIASTRLLTVESLL